MREMEKSDLFTFDSKYGDEARRVHARMKHAWKPKYTNIPLASWRKRVEWLTRERSYLKALKKFDDARENKADLAGIIEETAAKLEAHY